MALRSENLANDVGAVFSRLSRVVRCLDRENIPLYWVWLPVTPSEWAALAEYLGFDYDNPPHHVEYMGIRIPRPEYQRRGSLPNII